MTRASTLAISLLLGACGGGEPSLDGRCGDGIQQEREGCDDGNTQPGDGCSAFCVPEAEEGSVFEASHPLHEHLIVLVQRRLQCLPHVAWKQPTANWAWLVLKN